MPIVIEDAAFPLVVVTLPKVWTETEWDTYLAQMRRFPARRRAYVTLTDARGAGTPSAAQRRRAAEVMAEDAETSRAYNVANALVFDSAILRGMVTAITWLTPPPVPMQSFATPALALAWLDDTFVARKGVRLESWGPFETDRPR
ncbi:MAG: hypothetical protein KF901_06715 [Myxococcales bacterium]|nr:hypothetical protein [Myxococcales bacterium]